MGNIIKLRTIWRNSVGNTKFTIYFIGRENFRFNGILQCLVSAFEQLLLTWRYINVILIVGLID